MTIKKYARWAALAAALMMPAAALAQDQAPAQQQPAPTQPQPSQQGETGQQQPMQPENAPSGTEGTQGNQGAMGQEGQQGQQGQNAKLSKNEIDTLAFLKQVNEDEIKEGKLAQTKGSTSAVKDFGKTLVTDHQNLNQEITKFAKDNNITLPSKSKLPTEDQSQLRMLTQQSTQMRQKHGAAFDQMFLQNMVQDHQKVLARIDTAATQTQNQALQALLNDKIKPVLQAHQDRANELMKSNAQAMR